MTDSKVITLPSDHRDPQWWDDSCVFVRWKIEREPHSPIITGVGTIVVEREDLDIDDNDDDDCYREVGRIQIVKVPVGNYDVAMAMDALSSDHDLLASGIFDGGYYDHEFYDWMVEELGLEFMSDAVFVLDLKLDETYNDPDGSVAAHAALDALLTFGGEQSPLITFHRTSVNQDMRDSLEKEGLWAWVHALRAKKWKDVYVAEGSR